MTFKIDSKLKQAFGKVAVICGGNSSEREVSLKSGQAVLNGLTQAGVDCFSIDLYGKNSEQQPLEQLQNIYFERAFLILHGPVGEDGILQGSLELLNKPYTGSGVAASAIGMDKLLTKQLWIANAMPTPDFAICNNEQELEDIIVSLGLPMIVKPIHEGSSIGITKVHNKNELVEAVKLARKYDRHVMAERWLGGAEFTVGILNGKALPPIQLGTNHIFYDYAAKYESNDTSYSFDNNLTAKQERELCDLAEQAFKVLGCETWGRVDLMQDEKNNFQLLEINTAPGMTEHSLIPRAAAYKGICFEQLVVDILRATL